ncbi:MAG: hypothetical protein OQL19_11075 [Gammaproteobacteria bacterium]|nr:hypothetical protein [Gammaproteobacteria bacterium]
MKNNYFRAVLVFSVFLICLYFFYIIKLPKLDFPLVIVDVISKTDGGSFNISIEDKNHRKFEFGLLHMNNSDTLYFIREPILFPFIHKISWCDKKANSLYNIVNEWMNNIEGDSSRKKEFVVLKKFTEDYLRNRNLKCAENEIRDQ